ncbi:hypothetical protein K466DRAFT_652356 [Polyporus arcularius HHB13444]|uniref:Uncharacterized protein n=1 Tax=Polyporus arcularius HHB13444 TaxID=1314778 RepID=A0A5C3PKY1_9APHY|nr:hypothetical protein K466DRAFT_652356 [Polyporus arcularius HHB13444]
MPCVGQDEDRYQFVVFSEGVQLDCHPVRRTIRPRVPPRPSAPNTTLSLFQGSVSTPHARYQLVPLLYNGTMDVSGSLVTQRANLHYLEHSATPDIVSSMSGITPDSAPPATMSLTTVEHTTPASDAWTVGAELGADLDEGAGNFKQISEDLRDLASTQPCQDNAPPCGRHGSIDIQGASSTPTDDADEREVSVHLRATPSSRGPSPYVFDDVPSSNPHRRLPSLPCVPSAILSRHTLRPDEYTVAPRHATPHRMRADARFRVALGAGLDPEPTLPFHRNISGSNSDEHGKPQVDPTTRHSDVTANHVLTSIQTVDIEDPDIDASFLRADDRDLKRELQKAAAPQPSPERLPSRAEAGRAAQKLIDEISGSLSNRDQSASRNRRHGGWRDQRPHQKNNRKSPPGRVPARNLLATIHRWEGAHLVKQSKGIPISWIMNATTWASCLLPTATFDLPLSWEHGRELDLHVSWMRPELQDALGRHYIHRRCKLVKVLETAAESSQRLAEKKRYSRALAITGCYVWHRSEEDGAAVDVVVIIDHCNRSASHAK